MYHVASASSSEAWELGATPLLNHFSVLFYEHLRLPTLAISNDFDDWSAIEIVVLNAFLSAVLSAVLKTCFIAGFGREEEETEEKGEEKEEKENSTSFN